MPYQAIASAVGGIADAIAQGDTARKAYKYQEKAADNAQKRRFEAFDREAHYNSPEEQMKRLNDAGLNPGLMYGGAGGAGGTSMASAPQGGGADAGIKASSKSDMMMSIAQLTQTAIQERVAKAQENNLNAGAEKDRAEAEAIGGYRAEQAHATIASIVADTELKGVQREAEILDNEFKTVRNRIQSATEKEQIWMIDEALSKIENEVDYLTEEIDREKRLNRIGRRTEEAVVGQAYAELDKTIQDGVLKAMQAYEAQAGILLRQGELGLEWAKLKSNITTEKLRLVQNLIIKEQELKSADYRTFTEGLTSVFNTAVGGLTRIGETNQRAREERNRRDEWKRGTTTTETNLDLGDGERFTRTTKKPAKK